MYSGVSDAFKSKVAEASRTFKAKLVNVTNTGLILDSGFNAVKLYSQSNEDTETLSIGGTVSSYIEVEMKKPKYTVTGNEYTLYFGLTLDDGTTEWIPMGLFTAQKPTYSEDDTITFTAYDRFVSKLEYLFTSDLTYPADGKAVLTEIQTKSGITIANISSLPAGIMIPKRTVISEEDEDGNTTTTYTNPFDGFSYRETIGYIAQMYGKFSTINRSGEVELRWYTDSGFQVPNSRTLDDMERAEDSYEVQYVQCTIGDDSDNVLTSGSGATGISIENPVMTQAILDSVYTNVGGLHYLPTTCSLLGDPRIDLGDTIKVYRLNTKVVTIPLMSITQDFDGGLTTEIGSYGDTEQSSEASDAGPATKRMDRVYSELLLVKEVVATKASIAYLLANYANITELEATYASITQLDAVEAKIDTIIATDITVAYLEAHYANITMANVDTANIRQGFLENLMVSQGIIADRVVGTEVVATDVLTGVNVYADDITAGTLSVDRLVFRGTENSIVYELNSISGALQAVNVDTLNGEIITPRTITADRIIAQSITSNEINVANLVATGLIGANRITASNILVSDLKALNATIGGFTIGNTAIYNGTNTNISTTAGIYLGTDGIRAYKNSTAYTDIKNGILNCFGATINGTIYADSGMFGMFDIGTDGYITTGDESTTDGLLTIGYDGIEFKNSDGGDTWFRQGYLLIENGVDKVEIDADGLYVSETIGGTSQTTTIAYDSVSSSGITATTVTTSNLYVTGTLNLNVSGSMALNGSIDMGASNNTSNDIQIRQLVYTSGAVYMGHFKTYSSGYVRMGLYNQTLGSWNGAIDVTSSNVINIRPALSTVIAVTTSATTVSNDLYLSSSNTYFANAYGIRCGTTSSWLLRQYSATGHDNGTALGNGSYDTLIYTAGNVWKGSSTTTYFATTSTSDRRLKDYVSDMSAYEDMFMDLKPIAFRYHDGLYNAKNRQPLTQWGFYAQDTVQAFEKHGIDWNEQELVVVEDGELSAEEQKYVTTNDMLKMNYQNLIALDTHMIQQTILRVDNQEQRIRDLENLVYNLQFEIETLKMAVA